MWTNKHAPKSTGEIHQLAQAIQIKKLITEKKPLLLYGAAGTGKSTIINLIAKELDYEILEVNASDCRNKAEIESVLTKATQQSGLFKKNRLVIIDEIDGISGTVDKGGLAALTKLIQTSRQPIVFIANDPFDKRFNELRKKLTIMELPRPHTINIYETLKEILNKEKIEYKPEELQKLAEFSNNDIRAAINDLQKHTTENMLEINDMEYRNPEETIFQALKTILQGTNLNKAMTAMDNIDTNFDEGMLWLEENIPLEYKNPEELKNAYDCLAKADIARARIRRQQHWRLFVYQKIFASAGIALSKSSQKTGFIRYKRASRPLKIWLANLKNTKRRQIAEKLSKIMHISPKRIIKNFRLYSQIVKQQAVTKELRLTDDEINFLAQ